MDKKYVLDFVTQIVGDKVKAEMIVERLTDEGLLNLGYGNADIEAVVSKFTETFGTTKVSKYDRFAAKRLTDKYGRQAIIGIIQLLGDNRTERYAPVVGNMAQMEEKIVSILNFLRTINKEEIDI